MSLEPHRHKKRFGQHFLHERAFVERIVNAIAPKPDDALIEIGPGDGALTLALLTRVDRLTAIEIDRDVIPRLLARAEGVGELTLVEADALEVDLDAIAPGRPLRLVGNLPYNISTPLLFHMLRFADRVTDMHFMLQKEVVERMAAPPGNKVYGRLSVMLQVRCVVERLFNVPAGAFQPPPKVESAVVRLVPRARDTLAFRDHGVLDRVVRAAFAQRRKTLRNALSGVAGEADFAAAGIDPGARAETVAVGGFVALANAVHAREAAAG